MLNILIASALAAQSIMYIKGGACRVPDTFDRAVDPVVLVLFNGKFSARSTWRGLSDSDLMARTILSEIGGTVLTDNGADDAAGIGWVLLNRTRSDKFWYAKGSIYQAVVSKGQFHGMSGVPSRDGLGYIYPGNVAMVANPEAYDRWFGGPGQGRRAYWTAVAIADCIISEHVSDPTNGSLFFSSAKYKRDSQDDLVRDANGKLIVEPYADGRIRFRHTPNGISYSLDELAAQGGVGMSP